MSVLNLPQNVFGGICKFLEEKSLLRLREVSKATRKNVEFSVLNTHKTVVEAFYIENIDNQKQLRVSFDQRRDILIWKMCILMKSDRSRIRSLYSYFDVHLNQSETLSLIEHLGPLIRHAKIDMLILDNNQIQYIPILSSLIDRNSVYRLCVRKTDIEIDFKEWFALIKKLNVKAVTYFLHLLTKETIKAVQQVSDTVKDLVVYVNSLDSNGKQYVVPFVQDILSRKCERFHFREIHRTNVIEAWADVERLIEYFHRLEKKVTFSSSTVQQPMDIKIGKYRVRATNSFAPGVDMRLLSIEHL